MRRHGGVHGGMYFIDIGDLVLCDDINLVAKFLTWRTPFDQEVDGGWWADLRR